MLKREKSKRKEQAKVIKKVFILTIACLPLCFKETCIFPFLTLYKRGPRSQARRKNKHFKN